MARMLTLTPIVAAIVLAASIASADTVFNAGPAPAPVWDGKKLPIVGAEYEETEATTLWMKSDAPMTAEHEHVWAWTPATTTAKPGFTRMVDTVIGKTKQGGWHMEQYHVNQQLVHGTQPEGELAYFAAGYADGYSIAQRIWNSWETNAALQWEQNMENPKAVNQNWTKNFFMTQFNFTRMIAARKLTHFEEHAAKQLQMTRGRSEGFNARLKDASKPKIEHGAQPLSYLQMWFFSGGIDRMVIPDYSYYITAGGSWADFVPWFPSDSPFWSNASSNPFGMMSTVNNGAMGSSAAVGKPPMSDEALQNILVDPATGVPRRRNPRSGHCVCGVRLTEDDLWVARGTQNTFKNMNDSVTILTLESQVAMVRMQESMASLQDMYLTSNKMFLCSTGDANGPHKFLGGVSPQSTLSPFQSLYAAMHTTSIETFHKQVSEHVGVQATSWFLVDFKKFVPAAKGKNATLLPRAAFAVDVFPGNGIAFGEDVTANLTRGQTIVNSNQPVTRAAVKDCQYCWIRSLAEGPTVRQYPILGAKATTFEEFFRIARHNEWKTDPWSVLPPPFNPMRCSGLAIGNRDDLNNKLTNTTWGPQMHCGNDHFGVIDASGTSWKMWLGGVEAGAKVTAFPFVGIIGPTYENKDTPPYRPVNRTLTQSDEYHYPPVRFVNAIPPQWQIAPVSPTRDSNGPFPGHSGAETVVAAFGAGCLIAAVVVGSIVYKRRANLAAASRRTAGVPCEDTDLLYRQS